MTKPKLANIENRSRLEIFAVVFFFFNLAFLLFRFYRTYIYGEGWPTATPLFDPQYRFLDFYEINRAIYGLNPYIGGATNYPPFMIVLALPFAYAFEYCRFNSLGALLAFAEPVMKDSILVFVSIFYGCVLGAAVLGIVLKNRKKTLKDFSAAFILFAMLAVSTPVIFAIDRGNYCLFTTVFLVLWAVIEEEKPDSIWGAVFLGLAAATKIYPVYMLLVYIVGRKWKKLAAAVITGLVTTIVPIFFFQGGFWDNCRWFYHGVLDFGGGGSYRLSYNVGITGLVGYLFRMIGAMPRTGVIKFAWLFCGVVFTALTAIIFFFERSTWKKVLMVTALMVFLTPNSGLYNSCYLIAPILIMILGDEELSSKDIPYLVLTALLMVPFSYSYLPNVDYNGFYNEMNTAILVDGLLYLALILYYIGTGMITVIRRKQANASKQPS